MMEEQFQKQFRERYPNLRSEIENFCEKHRLTISVRDMDGNVMDVARSNLVWGALLRGIMYEEEFARNLEQAKDKITFV
jgi:hypothetical protein